MHSTEFFSVAQGKSSTYSGKLRENSGNLVFQKCGHPVIPYSLLKGTLIRGLKGPEIVIC